MQPGATHALSHRSSLSHPYYIYLFFYLYRTPSHPTSRYAISTFWLRCFLSSDCWLLIDCGTRCPNPCCRSADMGKSLKRSIISLVFRRQTCSHAGVRYGYCCARVRRFIKPASICPHPSMTPSPACKTFTAMNHPSISSRGPQHRAITFQPLHKVPFSQILFICRLLWTQMPFSLHAAA